MLITEKVEQQKFARPPWLLQQLRLPRKRHNPDLNQAFSNGLVRMSDSGWEVTSQLFEICYMGACEYEWDAPIPKALEALRVCEDIIAFTHNFSLKNAPCPKWFELNTRSLRNKEKIEKHRRNLIPENVNVHIICHKLYREATIEFIQNLIDQKVEVRDNPCFDYNLIKNPLCLHLGQIAGWLDIQNHFIFFSHREVFSLMENFPLHLLNFATIEKLSPNLLL